MVAVNTDSAAFVAPGRNATGEELYRAGLACSTGQGAPLSYVQAHKWFNLAALAGVAEAKVYRKELSELMCSADVAEAQAEAREWLANAAKSPVADAPAPTPETAPVSEPAPQEVVELEVASIAA
ncbi:MAG: hypothetical protein PVI23_04480 [Maricaulaceae bacterium]|jgi:TPR repeat protein